MAAFSLDNTFGATFLGLIAASILFGTSNLQIYFYYHRYPNDFTLHRVAVAVIWLLDACILAFTTHAVYHYLVTGYGDFLTLNDYSVVENMLTDFLIPSVQTLYLIRIWRLSGPNKVMPVIASFAVLAGWVLALLSGVRIWETETFTGIDDISWVIYVSFGTATGIDILLAVTLCYYLHTRKTQFKPTNSKINMLMYWVVSTGALTSACSSAIVILYALMPNNLIYLGVYFSLTKLYLNSFMAMLNSRHDIRRRHGDQTQTAPSAVGVVRSFPYTGVSVSVSHDKYRDVDVIPLHHRTLKDLGEDRDSAFAQDSPGYVPHDVVHAV